MSPVDSFALGFVLAALFSGACAWRTCRRYRIEARHEGYSEGVIAGRIIERRERDQARLMDLGF